MGDTGSAARFFQKCQFSEDELLFCRAKAILEAWNQNLANTADNSTSLPSEHVASALSDVATLVSLGRVGLSLRSGHFTSVTPRELKRLCESLIVTILSIGESVLHEPRQERRIQNGCLVKNAATPKQTGTMMITISHWKSDGSVDDVTLSITQQSEALGEAGSASRFRYCAKADASERRNSKHPTVKPLALMRYLCRLVCPPDGIVLDPFCGSGTTLEAARLEGFGAIGCELNAEYIQDCKERLKQGVLF
jgi:hypothetical protein